MNEWLHRFGRLRHDEWLHLSASYDCSRVATLLGLLILSDSVRWPANNFQGCNYTFATPGVSACRMNCSIEQPGGNRYAYGAQAACVAGHLNKAETCRQGRSTRNAWTGGPFGGPAAWGVYFGGWHVI